MEYEKVVDGHPVGPEYKRSFTSGSYNPTQKLLQENETGDIYSFDVKKKILFNGPVKYQKYEEVIVMFGLLLCFNIRRDKYPYWILLKKLSQK